MKKLLRSLAVISGLLICTSAGCKHEDVSVTPGTGTTTNPNPPGPASGKWIVTYFLDDGTDMTHHLDGYSFDFKSGGALEVNTGAALVSGTWRTATDDSKPKFIITLSGADAMLAEVAEDWLIKVNTSNEIDLNKSGGHPRELHFTRQ